MSTATVATAQQTQYDATMLLNALRNVEPYASTDTTFLALCALQLASDGETLTIAATDRFTIATETVTNVERGDTPAEFSFLLERKDLARLLSLLKDAPKNVHYWPVTLMVDGDTLTVAAPAATSTFRAAPGEFPRWRSIMQGAYENRGSGIPHICVDPRLLARFAKVTVNGRKNQAMRLYFGNMPTKPIAVEIGETFRAVVMPVRYDWPTS